MSRKLIPFCPQQENPSFGKPFHACFFALFQLLFAFVPAFGQNDGIPRGAQLPYIRYESEEAMIGGSATLQQAPDYQQQAIASEASNQKYVSLPSNGAYVEWTTTQAAQGVNLRFTMPDNSNGTGQSGALSLFVNGVKVKTINLSSYWAYQYFHSGQYEPEQTPGGKTFMRFDEVHFKLDSPISAGSKVRIAKDNGDGLTYGVDFVELEPVPAALLAPANSLSVTAYGANGTDQTDDYAAFTQCLAAAASQGKNVYIPAGRFLLSDKIALNVSNMKIQGAGIWHTEIFFSTDKQFYGGILARATNVEISDFSLNTQNNDRFKYDEQNSRLGDIYKVYKGFMGTYGTGSRIHDVWVEHFECGFWIAGYDPPYPIDITQDLVISRARIRNNYADGVNFCQGTSNSVVEYSSIRNSGDDGLAMWPNNAMSAPTERNNVFRYNTIENIWRAGGVAIFGGTGHQVYRNIFKDGVGGSAIRFTNDFPGYTFEQNAPKIVLTDNYIVGCGTSQDLWDRKRGAIEFFTPQGIYDIEFNNTQIINSQRHAVQIYGTTRNIVFNNTKVDGTGVDYFVDQPTMDDWGGFAILTQASGDVTFNSISYNRLESGELKKHNQSYDVRFGGIVPLNDITLDQSNFSLAEGKMAQLTVNYNPLNPTEKGVTWTSSNSAVATVVDAGTGKATITGKAVGSAVITARSVANGPNGQPISRTSTVNVTPAVNVIATDAAAGEGGNSGAFTISTSATGANITVNYILSGTATSSDYSPALSGSVTLTSAAPSQTITITPIDDNSFEGSETLILTLQAGAGFSLGGSTSATIAIADNDNPPCTAPVIARTIVAPTIDQSIESAWNVAPMGNISKVTLGTMPGDFAGSRWRAMYDNTNLYVLVEVKDNAKFNDSGTSWWEDDVVELFIDGDNSKGTSYDGVNDFQLGFRYNDGIVKVGGSSVARTTGIQFATQNVTGGYNVEVKIPWSTIGVTPGLGNRIGLEVAVDDDDNSGTRDAQVSAFATTSNAWSTPAVFGSVYLTTCTEPPLEFPVITSAGTTSGTTGTAFSYGITASNSPVSFSASGLPAGLSVNSATGVISGVPIAAGTFSATISATNAAGTGSKPLIFNILNPSTQAPVISSNLTVSGSIGTTFSYAITASNGPTSFNATNLPVGLGVNTTTGLISGTPTQTGTRNVTITATNASGSDSKTLSLVITEAIGTITAYRTPGVITVNGSLSETGWNLSKSVSKNTVGTGNNTVTFGVLWDNTNLYVGVKVLDTNLFSDSPDAWEDDAIEVFIDANNNRLSTYDGQDNQIIKNYNKSTVQTKLAITGLQHGWSAISGGYCVELAIPWSQLGIAAPVNGTTLGFDLGYDDDDNGGGRDAQAVWNGTIENYQNTSAFGKLVLNSVTAGTRLDAEAIVDQLVVLFPNPVKGGVLQLQLPENEGDAIIQVLSMQGKLLIEKKNATDVITLNVAQLTKGVYLALMRTNGKVVIRKFVVD